MRAALIPMKPLADAKLRLSDALSPHERASLALAMLDDVVAACIGAAVFDEIAVISRDREVSWHVRELGSRPLVEPAMLDGLNPSLTFGQRYLARRMAAREIVVLPADIPLVRADDVRSVVAALGDADRAAVIAPAHDGGTNALAMRPPDLLPMRFGAQSAAAHAAEARERGIEPAELHLPALEFDVDTVDDLRELESRPAGEATSRWLAERAASGARGR